MSSRTVRVAFPASDALHERLDQFLREAAASPDADQSALLNELLDDFLNDLLAAFFDGPIDAVGVQGGVATMVQGGVKIINKAARALVRNLVGKAGPAEQQALAAHFRGLTAERDGRLYLAFPLTGHDGAELQRVFDGYLVGESGYSRDLVTVMCRLCDDALRHYFDGLVGCVKLNAFNRGIVATARKTIQKAAYMAVEKGLPALGRPHKEPVVRHFSGMLLTPA